MSKYGEQIFSGWVPFKETNRYIKRVFSAERMRFGVVHVLFVCCMVAVASSSVPQAGADSGVAKRRRSGVVGPGGDENNSAPESSPLSRSRRSSSKSLSSEEVFLEEKLAKELASSELCEEPKKTKICCFRQRVVALYEKYPWAFVAAPFACGAAVALLSYLYSGKLF